MCVKKIVQDENVEMLYIFRDYSRLQSAGIIVKQSLNLSLGLCSHQILIIAVFFIVMDLLLGKLVTLHKMLLMV